MIDWVEDVIRIHAVMSGMGSNYQPVGQKDNARLAEEQRAQYLRQGQYRNESQANAFSALSSGCDCQCHYRGWG